MRVGVALLFASFFISADLFAQTGPPDSDIWLLELNENGGVFDFNQPVNITDRPGYDNQPAFSLETHFILYTSMREDNQTDIYRYNIDSKTTVRVTNTPESEYSPTFALDGSHFSVVRVEKDSSQRLWRFDIDGTNPKRISDVDSVGYHCWLSNRDVALFVLTKPVSLQFLNIDTNHVEKIANNIGRCMIKKHNQGVYFVSTRDSVKTICIADVDGNVKVLAKTFQNVEDFAILNEHILVTAYGNRIYKYDFKKDTEWEEVIDFSRHVHIPNISRIAISPDGKRVALVSTNPVR